MRDVSSGGTRSRLVELDGLRGVAVVMVLAWHFLGAMIDTHLGWWAGVTYRILFLGRTGVDLFFVLSGFLITRIILTRTSSGFDFLKIFYIKRTLRIFPPYFLLLAVFWLVVLIGVNNSAFNADTPLWRHLTFTQNFWMSEANMWGPGGISVSWSVAIEEHYYLFFPLFALILPPRMLPASLCMFGAVSIIWRAGAYFISPENSYTPYVMTLSRLDGLAAGGLVAWAFLDDEARSRLIENKARIKKLFWILIAGIPFFIISLKVNLPATMFYFGHTYLTLLFVLTVIRVLLDIGSDRLGWLRSPAFTYFGRISYSLYLFHPLILSSCFLLAQRPERIRNWGDAGIAALAFATALGFCTALYRQYETPFLNYGKKWRY